MVLGSTKQGDALFKSIKGLRPDAILQSIAYRGNRAAMNNQYYGMMLNYSVSAYRDNRAAMHNQYYGLMLFYSLRPIEATAPPCITNKLSPVEAE